MKCPNCGTDNPVGENFCENCGFSLDSASANMATMMSTGPTNVANAGNTAPTVAAGSGKLTANARLQNGRYVVEKILGQGGMGAAVLARDTRVSNKTVVIKELVSDNTDPVQRQEDVRNFEREVETLSQIDHPLVPTVTDSFQEGSRYYMVQEYAAGENLETHMERLNKPMPEREALAYTSQVLDILDYLSQQTPPIIHRDIKPANIIIGSKDKRAHLVDFGIARADVAKNTQRKQTSALGTPGYAPPEQYQGNADARSDLYALAATLHHLVTNRDPRNYPPFTYPPARSLNQQLAPEIERVLNRALSIDVNKRYQNAAAMKHDIDEILVNRFGLPADTSSYTLATSGPMKPPMTSAPPPIPATPPPPPPPPYIAPRPPYQQTGAYQQGGPYQQQGFRPQPGMQGGFPIQQQRGGSNVRRNFLFLLLVIIVLGSAFLILPRLNTSGSGGASGNGIGAKQVDGEYIGISDGSFAFDTDRPSGQSKQQGSAKLAAKDSVSAQSLWHSALTQDSSDAEALIYLEDQRVLTSGKPYITLVVGTILTGPDHSVGRDDLQGAYVAQKEYNVDYGAKLGGVQVRLLIANSGSSGANAGVVAQQIVQAAKADPTIVGVMGWPFSAHTKNAIQVLSSAQIPMVSSTASSDDLTGISPNFFRVAPSNNGQAIVAAKYAKQKLNAKNVALFQDPANPYSQSLAGDFKQQFVSNGGQVISENYTIGNATSISQALTHALKQVPPPDLIYFAGYASDAGDALLKELLKHPDFNNLQVLGGDSLYDLGGYPDDVKAGFSRMHFTAFSYPDVWDVLGYGNRKPAFFNEYIDAFDPQGTHKGGPYGFTRADGNVILAYDAAIALLTGCKNGLGGKTSLTPSDLRNGIQLITASSPIQGVSGQIAFDPSGDPVDKAIVMLTVDPGGHIQMEPQLGAGKFLV